MQIEIKIDSSCTEPKILVVTNAMTEELQNLLAKLSESSPQVITGVRGQRLEVLEPSALIRIYAHSGKSFAVTEKGEYILRLRLYELEKMLDKKTFVRISNSEIINLKKVNCFDLSFTGTICIKFLDGTTSYASRRYVSKIKQLLGIRR
ncbi:MAG: LytTR family transcriptional regulator [Lachnospiraceae bacterium]|nr:LytTR family transcriptional regulator [Lachnospiraceae bacterium]